MANTTPFLGLRGTGDWGSIELKPDSYRARILRVFPNGKAPLTALLNLVKSEKLKESPIFHWYIKGLSSQSGTVAGVYTNTGLSSAYASAGAAGDTVYVKMSLADSKEFRVGHVALLRCSADWRVDVTAKVTGRTEAGASSYLTCVLLEADDNAPAVVGSYAAHDLSDVDRAIVIGNVNMQGGSLPTAIARDPVLMTNQTQIWKTSLNLTRTELQTTLRTGSAYDEAKKDCLQDHSVEIEKSILWSILTSNTGSNGKPELTTKGIVPTIKEYAAANCSDYAYSSDFGGKTWLEGGEDWLDLQLEKMFTYGDEEKLAFAGLGAVTGINRMIKAKGNFDFTQETAAYGIKVWSWTTPYGVLKIKTHPLFALEPTMRNAMVVLEPRKIKWRFIQDTKFLKDDAWEKGGSANSDSKLEAYLTEAGLEFEDVSGWGLLNGVGLDNALTA